MLTRVQTDFTAAESFEQRVVNSKLYGACLEHECWLAHCALTSCACCRFVSCSALERLGLLSHKFTALSHYLGQLRDHVTRARQGVLEQAQARLNEQHAALQQRLATFAGGLDAKQAHVIALVDVSTGWRGLPSCSLLLLLTLCLLC